MDHDISEFASVSLQESVLERSVLSIPGAARRLDVDLEDLLGEEERGEDPVELSADEEHGEGVVGRLLVEEWKRDRGFGHGLLA